MKRLLKTTIIFSMLLVIMTVFICAKEKSITENESIKKYCVEVNEIDRLTQNDEKEKSLEKIAELMEGLRQHENMTAGKGEILVCITAVILMIILSFYVWFSIIRPFEAMKKYAETIASGNLDIPLTYERTNYFGEFTWAFDSMRREILRARQCEQEAILNNKTVIATLSHDIKTPLASIRAYTEGLEAGLGRTHEARKKYLEIIMKKCDEVAKLVNDLFIHTVSDLDRLQIVCEKTDVSVLLNTIVKELQDEKKDIVYLKKTDKTQAVTDRRRFYQIMENLVNNARKYAKGDIEITLDEKDGYMVIYVKDYGEGINEEDMPFIFNKFYRGKNSMEKEGSGLGLYIVKYIIE